jgi:5-methylcytosine-specific restriction endonuclease McrA
MLDKSIYHHKEYRQLYRGSKRFDRSCRNHGSCGYCERNRTFFDKKARLRLEGQEDEHFSYWDYIDFYQAYDMSPWDM